MGIAPPSSYFKISRKDKRCTLPSTSRGTGLMGEYHYMLQEQCCIIMFDCNICRQHTVSRRREEMESWTMPCSRYSPSLGLLPLLKPGSHRSAENLFIKHSSECKKCYSDIERPVYRASSFSRHSWAISSARSVGTFVDRETTSKETKTS